MNKDYGIIVHPENFEDLLSMTPDEAGNILQNMIRTFNGDKAKVFNDRYLDYVSTDLCGRVLRDRELSERKSRAGKMGGAPMGNSNRNQAEIKQKTSRNQAETSPNTNTNTNTNINIGFRPNQFTAGVSKTEIDFDELAKKLIKN